MWGRRGGGGGQGAFLSMGKWGMVYNVFPTCLLFVVVVVLDLLLTRDVEHSKERSTVIFRASTRFSIFHRKIFFGGTFIALYSSFDYFLYRVNV